MRTLFMIISIFLGSVLFGQQQEIVYQGFLSDTNIILPKYKGGEHAFHMLLINNIKYPEKAKIMGTQGRVFVTFIVEKDGSVSNIKLLKGIGGGCDEEAMRVLKLTSGNWEPGMMNGDPVRVQFNMPIKFTLDNSKPISTESTLAYNKAVKLMDDAKYEKAILYLEEYEPGTLLYADARYAIGVCKYLLLDYKGAIPFWEESLAGGLADSRNMIAETYFKLGNEYQEQKKLPIAISCFTKSLEYIPDDINVLYNRGIAYFYLGDSIHACEDWQKIEDLGSIESKELLNEHCQSCE